MSSFFTIAFDAVFLLFVVAAIIGHILLLGALFRPFGGRLYPTPLLMWHGMRAQSVR